ncbi:MAG: prolipoprotein diacylglyceryl transferase [Gammaproteobacteria bacterium]|nr:prolipoprotein diacylglyceryl transferase [Gammaproteobacteria bacterium]HJL96304.1 prolipoprotein diacylglyceryl transferase [SAR86 cluster bacterium]HJM59800.1 prolipoprotein diacylglyceryl transferase [SAR86 cluster bacterium]|tara:strand:- start:5020 stop:5811 length:792 start_codon:yes stop_codon:yes gene_type:complete
MILPEIDPIALQLGPLAIRWYSLTWIGAISLIYYLMIKRSNSLSSDQVSDLIFYGVIGAIIGGRLGYMFFYSLGQVIADPLSIFRVWEGGLSFHGGLIGVLISTLLLAKRWRIKYFWLMDRIAPCIPPGLGTVRVGNFLNSELLGRPTNSTWGVIFPSDSLSVLRHPSQLYQALAEGVLLFVFLLWISRKPKPTMNISGYFLIGYGVLRFCTEFYRTPDGHIGLVAFDLFTRGQMLCLPMIVIGLYLIYYSHLKNGSENETIS